MALVLTNLSILIQNCGQFDFYFKYMITILDYC